VRAAVARQPVITLSPPALLFQVEHPPRGPPPAVVCV
jgi:hypothetical protein